MEAVMIVPTNTIIDIDKLEDYKWEQMMELRSRKIKSELKQIY